MTTWRVLAQVLDEDHKTIAVSEWHVECPCSADNVTLSDREAIHEIVNEAWGKMVKLAERRLQEHYADCG